MRTFGLKHPELGHEPMQRIVSPVHDSQGHTGTSLVSFKDPLLVLILGEWW